MVSRTKHERHMRRLQQLTIAFSEMCASVDLVLTIGSDGGLLEVKWCREHKES
jgi:hypothetical protein